jgi:hypothetical protein
MSDIFLKYVIEDLDTAEKLYVIFQQQNWTIWWDPYRADPDDDDYAELVVEELKNAKVVVMLWSSAAHKARLTRETLKKESHNPPVLVLLEKVDPPLPLMLLREFDLSDWDGATSYPGLKSLLRHLRALISTQPLTEPHASDGDLTRLTLAKFLRPQKERTDVEAEKKHPDLLREDSARFSGVFISYRRDEAKAHAKWLYDRLAAHFGREKIFLDLENVGLGKNFVKVITSAAESCSVMVALIGRQWLRSADGQSGLDDFVRLEVATALGRNIDVIPIILPGASMPSSKDLPDDLSSLAHNNALPLSENRWERDVEDLIKSLESFLNN